MLSSFVEEIDQSEVPVDAFTARTGEEALVVAAKNGDKQAFERLAAPGY